MSNDKIDYVWEARLNKKYHCTVTRIAERKGQLKIVDEENQEVLLNKEVGLSYGAIFGPDIDDVMDWEQTCIETVDRCN